MSPATVTRLEKVAVDNGFDQEQPRDGVWLAFSSTQAPLRLWLTAQDEGVLVAALSQSHVDAALGEHGTPIQVFMPPGAVAARSVGSVADLHRMVRRAFQLSRTLPDELLNTFKRATGALPRTTEIERLVVERVGQELFRNGLLEYWQGRCAVTGLAIRELLRAGHIKPWAACETDAERLDVFNALLLAPNLDAAFDRGFITIADDGTVLISPQLLEADRRALGLELPLRVATLTLGHQQYLKFHRANVFVAAPFVMSPPVTTATAQRTPERTIRIPIKISQGQITYLYGGALPELADCASGEIVLPEFAVKDLATRARLNAEKVVPFLPQGTELRLRISKNLAPEALESQVIETSVHGLGVVSVNWWKRGHVSSRRV